MNELIAIISDLVPSKKQISGIKARTLMGGVSSISVSVCPLQWRVLLLCQQGKLRPWDIFHSPNNRWAHALLIPRISWFKCGSQIQIVKSHVRQFETESSDWCCFYSVGLSVSLRVSFKVAKNSASGAVHKVRHARGEGGLEGVTVCDRGRGPRACDVV